MNQQGLPSSAKNAANSIVKLDMGLAMSKFIIHFQAARDQKDCFTCRDCPEHSTDSVGDIPAARSSLAVKLMFELLNHNQEFKRKAGYRVQRLEGLPHEHVIPSWHDSLLYIPKFMHRCARRENVKLSGTWFSKMYGLVSRIHKT